MKYVKKVFGVLASFMLIAGVFTSCSDSDNSSPNEPSNDRTYLADGGEVRVIAGESTTVYVKGKTKVDVFTCAGLTVDPLGDEAFKITAAEDASDAQVSLNFNDGSENDEGVNVTLYLSSPYYVLNISLDESLATDAASITVSYGSGDAVKETIDAVYTAGETTATAKLKKEYADSYDWFSPVKINVYNSENTAITTEQSVGYFCYTASSGNGYLADSTITVSSAVASRTFTLNFEGFTIAGGSVTGLVYTKVENDFTTEGDTANAKAALVTVAADGASATFEVEAAYTNDSGWFQLNLSSVVITDSSNSTVTLTSGNTDAWFEYKDGMAQKLSYVALTDSDYTQTLLEATSLPSGFSSNTSTILSDGLSIPADAKAFKVVYTKGESETLTASSSWLSLYTDSSWSNVVKLVNSYDSSFSADDTTFTVYITDSTSVTAFKAGNFYVAGSADITGTIAITYAQ